MPGSYNKKNDSELLVLIQEGNRAAFSELVERHAKTFYRLAFRFLSSREEAEDMVQEAFLKLWQNPFLFNVKKNVKFTTWFYKVVVNMCNDGLRKKPYAPLPDNESLVEEGKNPAEVAFENAKQIALEYEISRLPAKQRTALNLCFYEEIKGAEAAEILGVSAKAVESLLMRAKTTLKKNLKGYL